MTGNNNLPPTSSAAQRNEGIILVPLICGFKRRFYFLTFEKIGTVV